MNPQEMQFKIDELEKRVAALEDRFTQMEPAPVEPAPVVVPVTEEQTPTPELAPVVVDDLVAKTTASLLADPVFLLAVVSALQSIGYAVTAPNPEIK